jgi:hypothetical protein
MVASWVRRGPFGGVAQEVRRPLHAKAVLAVLGVGALMGPSDKRMKATGGPGIVPFELAGSRVKVDAILRQWGPDGRAAAEESLVLDQVWQVTYAVSLALSAAEAGDAFGERGWDRAARAAGPLGWASLVAASLDAVENTSLLAVVRGSEGSFLPRLAQRSAQVKFALVAVALPYGLVGLALRGVEAARGGGSGRGRA